MDQPLTIHSELRLPAPFMHNKHLEEIERQLHGCGLMPTEARDRRWRMDPESPGGYIVTFTVALATTP